MGSGTRDTLWPMKNICSWQKVLYNASLCILNFLPGPKYLFRTSKDDVVDKNFSQKRFYLKPRCKPSFSRGASVILFPLRKLRSNRITDLYPHFRSEIVILHSACAPFRTTNSHRSRVNRYSLRSCFLSWHPACKAGGRSFRISSAHDPYPHPANPVRLPTQYPAVFAPLTRRRKWTPGRTGTTSINKVKPFPTKQIPSPNLHIPPGERSFPPGSLSFSGSASLYPQ